MLNLAKSGNAAMPIPSQPMQECSGGVTTRPWSPDRIVKAHECGTMRIRAHRKDSLTFAELNAKKHRIKSRCANTVTTIQSRSGVIADNVTNNNALLTRLKRRGNHKPFSGGNVIL